MDEGLVHAELLAACSSLGYSNGVTYQCEADCLETIKDLLRYLRKDDDRHEVRRALGDTRVMQTDLLPILQQHSDNEELLQLVVRLMVDLTNPALLLFREELPEEKVTRQQFMQLVRQQQGYKEAFTNHKAWKVMAARLRAILEIPVEEREEDHRLLLERMLVLVRNVLWAPANPQEGRTDDDASVHDQVLWAMHLSGMAELLLYMASSLSEHDMALHLLEIISLMLREQDAVCLATSNLHSSNQEKEEDNRRLQELRLQESLQREARRRASASRHSRFGGTYVVRQVKSISEQDLILHRPLANPSAISFDRNKRPRKHNKNRRPVQESTTTRRSTLAVRMFLQEFCVEFVSGSYNAIMSTVKDALDRVRAQDHDETYYLWSIRFFMEFNRHHNFKVELVTETMGIETFHFIQTHVDNYFDMMGMEKKKRAVWSRRMHRALRAYHELLATLAHMDASPLQDVRESSRVLKSRLFYMVEYREMMLLLLQNYDPIKMSMGYLRDAVEAAHVFLKLLESTCKRGRHIMVQGKGRKAHKKKAKATPAPAVLTQDQLQDLWDELSPEVVAVVQGEAHNLPEVVPFDALSEDPEDVQKEAAMRRISKHLKDKELPVAVALLRAAREVWPEGDIFGPQESDHTQDFLTLQEIFLANLSSPQDTPMQEEVEEEYGDEEEEEEERAAVFSEQELDFEGFVRRFASTKVVKAYSHLLQRYQTNTKHTNHCILKMFHRLAWDCKLPAIFFQASLFIVFLKAMQDPLRQSSESPREIARFGKYIMRQLYKVAEVNPKVFVELLFWKTNKEALEIECGYGEQEAGKAAAKQAWTEEEDDELKILYEEAEQMPAEERGENDIVDLIMDRLISRNRTRRTVIRKLRDMGLISSAKGLKRGSAPRINAPRTWTEEEEEELRRLYEENKEAMDIVGRIMDGLTLRRPKHRVVEKMLELGIVADRKALRKKRAKKPTTRKPKKTGQDFLSANQGSDEEGDEGSGSEGTSGSESEDEDSNTNTHQSTTNPPPPPPPSVPVVTPALISQGLGVVLGAGLGEAVEWLARIMRDVADDREEDGDFEPVPILAITQPCTTAMEDQEFHKLMRLVGLQPPMTHQEMFWRVPSRLSVAGLRKRAEYLTQGAAGGLQDIQNPDEPLEPVEDIQPAQVEPQKPKKTPNPKKTKTPRNSKAKTTPRVSSNSRSSEDKENHLNGDDNDGDGDGPTTLLQLLPHDDSSGDDAPLASLTARPSPPSSHPANRVNKRMLSDDSDEHTPQTNTANKDKKTKKKKKKKRLVLDSDSEEEMDAEVREEEGSEGEGQAEVVLQPSRKQRIRAIIDSDDD